MALTVETVAEEALNLPTEGRALLVEKLLASLAGQTDPRIEEQHLREIKERRSALQSGDTTLVDGPSAMAKARLQVRK